MKRPKPYICPQAAQCPAKGCSHRRPHPYYGNVDDCHSPTHMCPACVAAPVVDERKRK